MTREVKVGKIKIGKGNPLVLLAGPCVIESEKGCLSAAKKLKEICVKFNIPLIFKSSFDKANRMSQDSYRGPGLREGLRILGKVKQQLGLAILTDVHCQADVEKVARVADVIQIPAFLCRQTDLVMAAAKTGKVVNIKKGQFLAPWDIQPIIRKVESTGNKKIILTERGVCFGYNNLVSDFRSLGILRQFGYPVVYDATHSVQIPAGRGSCSGGQREFVSGLTRAAVAFGCDGIFLEVHPQPDKALCDAANMIDLKELVRLLKQIKNIAGVL